MRKTLTLLGVLALVLGVAAGATAGAGTLLARDSVDSRAVKDGSIRLADLTPGAELMIRDGWRYAHGLTKVGEASLDPALAAKLNAPVTEARLDPALAAKVNRTLPTTTLTRLGFVAGVETGQAAGDRFSRSVEFPLPVPKAIDRADIAVLSPGQTSAVCPGTYLDPRATAGKLCIFLGGVTEGTTNTSQIDVFPVAALGFYVQWRALAPGASRLFATYAFQA
jgi:hypothetical protein